MGQQKILLVDDIPENLDILVELLESEYHLETARGGVEAVTKAASFLPDLILLDLLMPGMDGVETCKRLRGLPELKLTRIVMLSAQYDVESRKRAYSAGAVDYVAKPFDHGEICAKVKIWLQMLRSEEVESVWREFDMASLVVGDAMLNLAAFRDTETGDHLFRVRWYSQLIAERLAAFGPYQGQIDDAFLANLYRASPLHDVGKVGIDDAILRKPGRLTCAEYEAMKQHTIIGHDLLQRAAARIPTAGYLKLAANIARSHHERFDGNGYPDRLTGRSIPLSARIVAVADVLDALTSVRPYKSAMTFSDSVRLIAKDSGKHFDPAVVDAFLYRLDDIELGRSEFAHSDFAYESRLV